MKKISYLGPKNTYSEQATRMLAQRMKTETELIGLPSLEAVAKSVSLKDADMGVMAYYNYLEGLVQESLDIIYENNLEIKAMQRLPIILSIGCHKENTNKTEVYSHQKALAQCSEWLWTNLKDSNRVPAINTAAAAEKVRETRSGLAIASTEALRERGLQIIAEDIGNKKNNRRNFTDFYLVARENNQQFEQTKRYLTMVAITPNIDKQGLLADILNQVAYHGLNNAKIHSRPALHDPGKCDFEPQMFYLEIISHKKDKHFLKCIDSLKYKLTPKNRDVEVVRVLGSYEKP